MHTVIVVHGTSTVGLVYSPILIVTNLLGISTEARHSCQAVLQELTSSRPRPYLYVYVNSQYVSVLVS